MLTQLIQFLWFFSSFILLPVTIGAIILGILTGRVNIHIEEGPSAFERGEPNPHVSTNMRWLKERDRLIQNASAEETPRPRGAVKTEEKIPLSLEKMPIIPSDFHEDSREEATPPAEAPAERDRAPLEIPRGEEEQDEEETFQFVGKVEVEVAEDFQRKIGGIPVVLRKGKKLQAIFNPDQVDGVDRASRLLAEDPDLGLLSRDLSPIRESKSAKIKARSKSPVVPHGTIEEEAEGGELAE